MLKKTIKSKIILSLLCITSLQMFAQPGNPIFGLTGETALNINFSPIAILDLETSALNTDLNINLSPPSEAGAPIGSNPLYSNNSIWLNYTCANPVVSSRHIEAHISSGTIPAGFELRLTVSSASGSGGGVRGTPANVGDVVLTTTPLSIITGINTAYTGNGANNGHQLSFSLHYDNSQYGSISSQTINNILITYTIVDD